MVKIEPGKSYRIKTTEKYSETYFENKYVKKHPIIVIEAHHRKLWPNGWEMQKGNPACLLFAARSGLSGIREWEDIWYGHIDGFGELVAAEELEEIINQE